MPLGYRTGLLTGLGLSALAAFVLPRWGRPISKAAIKGGMDAYESASETLMRLRETLADIAAEAAYERAVAQASTSDAPRATAAPRDEERREPEAAQPMAAQ